MKLRQVFMVALLSCTGLTSFNSYDKVPDENTRPKSVDTDALAEIKWRYVSNADMTPQNDTLIAPSIGAGTNEDAYFEDKALYPTTSFDMVSYFKNLTDYSPNNNIGSCGYVSLIQAMSYYDTFYNDDVIPENYDFGYSEAKTEAEAKAKSPGVLKQAYNEDLYSSYYKYAHATEDNDIQSKLTILNNQYDPDNKLYEDDESKDKDDEYDDNGNLISSVFEYAIGAGDYQKVLNAFYKDYKYTTTVNVHCFSDDDISQEEFINIIKDTIDSGNPIVVHINQRDSSGEPINRHSVVAYDYDKNGIYANFGWGSAYNHTLLLGGITGYTDIYYAATLDFSNFGHTHSDNYIINGKSYCGCNISDEVLVTKNPNKTGDSPILCWMKNPADSLEFYTIAFKYTSTGANVVSFETSHNVVTLSSELWKRIFYGCDGMIYVSFRRCSNLENYNEQISAFSRSTASLNYVTLAPSAYGFADAYPIDETTKTVFTDHIINNFSFRTRRYRTGYIHNEYIVMSCIRTDITEAFIEYEFDKPVYRIEVELAYWRDFSHDWLDKNRGSAKFSIWLIQDPMNPYDTGGWMTKLDLLSDSTALPRDRTKPAIYSIEFNAPITRFKFSCKVDTPITSDSNRGRICIGNMRLYSEEI